MSRYGPHLAQVYEMHWSRYAQNAAPTLREYFESLTVSRQVPALLDLGCGTGHLALHFLEAGCSVTGFDTSEDMLRHSRLRCRRYGLSGQANFIHQDIRAFTTNLPFGMVVSTYNTLNHLTFSDLESCFRSSRNALAPGGQALFDLNTVRGFAEWRDEEKLSNPTGFLRVARSFDADASRGCLAIEGHDGTDYFQEVIENYSYRVMDCLELLSKTGFKNVRAARVDDLKKALQNPENENRIFLVGEK
jgi:SAM-dependent methyltransferase